MAAIAGRGGDDVGHAGPLVRLTERLGLRNSYLLSAAIIALLGVMTVVPIGFVVVNSFNIGRPVDPWTFGLSGWVEGIFRSADTMKALGYSLLLASRAPLSVAVAFVIAWFLIRVQIPGRHALEIMLWTAFFLPPLPVTMGWILLLDPDNGLINTFLKKHSLPILNLDSVVGILWVHMSVATVPIMTLLLAPAFRMTDASMEEASRSSGAGTFYTLWRITLPLIFPAALTAMFAGLIRSLEAFEVEQLLGTPSGIYVYATRIYDLITYEPPKFSEAMALSSFVLGVLLVLSFAYQSILARRKFATLAGRGMSLRPMLIGRWRYFVAGLLFLYAGIAIGVPLFLLVIGSFMKLFGFFHVTAPFTTAHWTSVLGSPAFYLALKNTLIIGLGTGFLGILLYAVLGYLLARGALPGERLIGSMTWLPWAVPGMLLGLGLLWLLLTTPVLGLLYGNVGALLLALFIKELPLGVNMSSVAFSQISKDLEQSARVCGASWLTTYRRIVLPLTAPTLFAIFIVTFIGAVRDIGTTVLLVTPENQSLSLLMFEYANTGSLGGASVIGTIITAVSVGVALAARRLGLKLTMN
jgi:iron(III) transport system permease protein